MCSCGYNPCQCNDDTPVITWLDPTHYPCNPCSDDEICIETIPAKCITLSLENNSCFTLVGKSLQDILKLFADKICELETQIDICCSGGDITCPAPLGFTVITLGNSILGGLVDIGSPLAVTIPANSIVDMIVALADADQSLTAGYTLGATDLSPMDETFLLAANIPLELVPLNRYYATDTVFYFTSSGPVQIQIYINTNQ